MKREQIVGAARRMVLENPLRMLGMYVGDAYASLEEWEKWLDSGNPRSFPSGAGLMPPKRDAEAVSRAWAFLKASPVNRLLASTAWFYRDDSPEGKAFFRAVEEGNFRGAKEAVRLAPNYTAGYFNRTVLKLLEGRCEEWFLDVAELVLSSQWGAWSGGAVSPQEFADAFVPWLRRCLPEDALPDNVIIEAGEPFARAFGKFHFGKAEGQEGGRGKVTLLGVEGSGKTVLTMALVEAFKRYEPTGLYLRPDSRESYRFLMQQAGRLERGELPAQTANLKCLAWTVTVGDETIRKMDVLDYPGEIYRLAFLDAADDPDPEIFTARVAAYKDEISLFLSHLTGSGDVFVLFNLDDAANQRENAKNLDAVWVTNACLDYLRHLPHPPRVTFLLTQIDRYCQLGQEEVDVRRLYDRHLHLIARNFPDIPIFAVSAMHPDGRVGGIDRLVKILFGREAAEGNSRSVWDVPEAAVAKVRIRIEGIRRQREVERQRQILREEAERQERIRREEAERQERLRREEAERQERIRREKEERLAKRATLILGWVAALTAAGFVVRVLCAVVLGMMEVA